MTSKLPTVVIGAGPVGLAAAAYLIERREPFLILEAGDTVATSVRAWHQVRMFSPWKYVVDDAAARLLADTGWTSPPSDAYPTGGDLARLYLEPLGDHRSITPHLRLRHRVTHVFRQGLDRMTTRGRDRMPFVVRAVGPSGEVEILAKAVIDASGTWTQPNPLGGSGVLATGETAARNQIVCGIPDVAGTMRSRYAGKRVAVVGSGHSAFNVLLDLMRLVEAESGTRVDWVLRRRDLGQLFGGGADDQLAERGRLGARVKELVDRGQVRITTGFSIDRVEVDASGVILHSGDRSIGPVDEVINTTGFRPDLSLYSEIRLSLDPITESPRALAPLIDPNVHSCGTVPPHGVDELTHDDPGIYLVGMKSYGRAPTFLLLTGYEQVRSVVAAIAGDWESARTVALELPETGVCSGGEGSSCCAPAGVGAAAPVALGKSRGPSCTQ